MHDENFTLEAKRDAWAELQELATERGFDSVEEMQAYDREMDMQRQDYYGGLGV